jgi:tRNA/tmRNA/rRNA uracil-C5-methylase (TrmA/RlmC/RlmD family)
LGERQHDRLRKYVDISRAARRKFVQGTGGATFIDLFCGAGRAVEDGGVPFSEIHIADASEESCSAAEKRIGGAGGSAIAVVGKAEETVVGVVERLNPYGLHLRFSILTI